jgi:sulfate adenylyltransferase
MKTINLLLDKEQYFDLENLGHSVYYPLKNFMDEKTFISVSRKMKLLSGDIFPLPILLDIDESVAVQAKSLDRINLEYKGEIVGYIIPESIYQCNKKDICIDLFGTNKVDHPGVNKFLNSRDWFIGGETHLLKQVETEISKYQKFPNEIKEIIYDRGYKSVSGFQTRNIPHRAHEYLQRLALEHTDGLFIQPLLGMKKPGDFNSDVIIKSYQKLISEFYNSEKIIFSSLSASMFYAGPREAIFHAIIRRNYGCTHFIVGRDHAGVGDYYGKYEAHEFVKKYEHQLGIEILYYHGPFYCTHCECIATDKTCGCFSSNPDSIVEISGTNIRRMLTKDDSVDERLIRKEIVESIINDKLFIE